MVISKVTITWIKQKFQSGGLVGLTSVWSSVGRSNFQSKSTRWEVSKHWTVNPVSKGWQANHSGKSTSTRAQAHRCSTSARDVQICPFQLFSVLPCLHCAAPRPYSLIICRRPPIHTLTGIIPHTNCFLLRGQRTQRGVPWDPDDIVSST